MKNAPNGIRPASIHESLLAILSYFFISLTKTTVNMGNFVFSLLWIVLLVFVAWPVAGICGGLWILLQVWKTIGICYRNRRDVADPLYYFASFLSQPFEACFAFLKGITSFLEKLITWPRDCGHAISSGSTSFPAPL